MFVERLFPGIWIGLTADALMNYHILQIGCKQQRNCERDTQDDEHCPRERLYEIAHIAMHGKEEWKEGERDAERG